MQERVRDFGCHRPRQPQGAGEERTAAHEAVPAVALLHLFQRVGHVALGRALLRQRAFAPRAQKFGIEWSGLRVRHRIVTGLSPPQGTYLMASTLMMLFAVLSSRPSTRCIDSSMASSSSSTSPEASAMSAASKNAFCFSFGVESWFNAATDAFGFSNFRTSFLASPIMPWNSCSVVSLNSGSEFAYPRITAVSSSSKLPSAPA